MTIDALKIELADAVLWCTPILSENGMDEIQADDVIYSSDFVKTEDFARVWEQWEEFRERIPTEVWESAVAETSGGYITHNWFLSSQGHGAGLWDSRVPHLQQYVMKFDFHYSDTLELLNGP